MRTRGPFFQDDLGGSGGDPLPEPERDLGPDPDQARPIEAQECPSQPLPVLPKPQEHVSNT